MAAAIPALADRPVRQLVQAIVDPIGYYRRCFRARRGVVRVRMVPGLPPRQVLISDPEVLQELMGRDNGRGISAPGHLNELMEQVVGEHSLMLLEPIPHRARRRLLTPPFHGERLRAYGSLIQSIARQVFADLVPGQEWDARTRLERITMRVILSAVFGLHEGERYRRLEMLLQRNLRCAVLTVQVLTGALKALAAATEAMDTEELLFERLVDRGPDATLKPARPTPAKLLPAVHALWPMPFWMDAPMRWRMWWPRFVTRKMNSSKSRMRPDQSASLLRASEKSRPMKPKGPIVKSGPFFEINV